MGVVTVHPAFLRSSLWRHIQNLPARLLHGTAGRVIPVDEVPIPYGCDHSCYRPDVILLPGAQETTANQVVNLTLISGQARAIRRNGCRDDRMVIRHLRIVDEPLSEWLLARARNQLLAKGRLNDLDNPRQCMRDVLREMPT